MKAYVSDSRAGLRVGDEINTVMQKYDVRYLEKKLVFRWTTVVSLKRSSTRIPAYESMISGAPRSESIRSDLLGIRRASNYSGDALSTSGQSPPLSPAKRGVRRFVRNGVRSITPFPKRREGRSASSVMASGQIAPPCETAGRSPISSTRYAEILTALARWNVLRNPLHASARPPLP